LTFTDAQDAYAKLISGLKNADLHAYEDETVELETELQQISNWRNKYFASVEETISGDLSTHIFDIARHIAQHDGNAPQFFPFEERKEHDLDKLVQKLLDEDVGPRAKRQELQYEFNRDDRFWKILYYNFDQFWQQYHLCENKRMKGEDPIVPDQPPTVKQDHERDREFTLSEKEQIKQRDGYRCLCCGNTKRLEADHIVSWYEGGFTEFSNGQTLCSKCNGIKADHTIDFRRNVSLLTGPLPRFPRLIDMGLAPWKDSEEWEKIFRRSINFFYRCAAVASVKIGKRGDHFYNWEIELYDGNDASWIEPHLATIGEQVNEARKKAGGKEIESITIS
jgi:5-methylcytosine-specific restriction endonuclease McrA